MIKDISLKAKGPLLPQCCWDTTCLDLALPYCYHYRKNEEMEDKMLNLALVIMPTGCSKEDVFTSSRVALYFLPHIGTELCLKPETVFLDA